MRPVKHKRTPRHKRGVPRARALERRIPSLHDPKWCEAARSSVLAIDVHGRAHYNYRVKFKILGYAFLPRRSPFSKSFSEVIYQVIP